MAASSPESLTNLLLELSSRQADKEEAMDRLFNAAYEELHDLASALMIHERPDQTLQPTALVHEGYLRLIDSKRIDWQNRAHFFGIAGRAMRRVLVEHARKRSAEKRGGKLQRITFDENLAMQQCPEVEILDLDQALEGLAVLDKRMADVVEMRVFGGLTAKEVAHVLDISRQTVQEDWRVARMWLRRELEGGGAL
jgi:RNA polymerase sigma factor (TIGR02999 family)